MVAPFVVMVTHRDFKSSNSNSDSDGLDLKAGYVTFQVQVGCGMRFVSYVSAEQIVSRWTCDFSYEVS